jgi:hypothetical protein
VREDSKPTKQPTQEEPKYISIIWDPVEHPRLIPEVRQGYWKHIPTVVKSKEEIHTHQWTDIIKRETTYIPRQRTLFRDWLLPQDILDQREQVRIQLSKEGYKQKVDTLQKQCLIKYSSTWYRPIDSIELEITEDRLNLITNRIVLEDTRGIPIKISDLEPYTTKDLEDFIRPHTTYPG